MNAPKSSTRNVASTGNVLQSQVFDQPVEVLLSFVFFFLAFRSPQPWRALLFTGSAALFFETVWVRFWILRALRLNREHKSHEAHAAFLLALQLLPFWRDNEKLRALVGASLAAHNSGHLPDTVKWAERAIEHAKTPSKISLEIGSNAKTRQWKLTLVRTAHSMAGVGYSEQNNLQAAETHYRRVCEIARGQKNTLQQADSLALLAGILKKQGRLREALAAAERALALNGKSRVAFIIIVEAMRDMGRFDEARHNIARALQQCRHVTAHHETPSRALLFLALVYLEAMAEKPEAGLVALEKARADINIGRVQLWMNALEATLLAQQGLSEPSRRLSEQSENALANFENDVQTQRNVLSQLGRAALARGDWENCRKFYERYFQFNPLPVDSCAAFYRLGDCARGEGKVEEARCFYEKAVAEKFETYQCQRAQQRLDELDV